MLTLAFADGKQTVRCPQTSTFVAAMMIQISGNIAPQSVGQNNPSDGLGSAGRPPSDLFVVVLYEKP